jgi:hypothetical protein
MLNALSAFSGPVKGDISDIQKFPAENQVVIKKAKNF